MKGILLLSGGIDSPVAGYLIKQKDMDLVGLTFKNELFSEDESEIKAQKLSKIIGINKLYIINHGKMQTEIAKNCKRELFYVITRRIMWKIAELIASKENADYLVTGENLGQVGSQTLHKLVNIMQSVKITILQPILCNDKMETVKIARQIGTYEISKGPEMCSVFGPKHPSTKSNLNTVLQEEQKLDI